ncbi:Transcription factor [Stygiomarasmius scandens]|uniref:Transcription factor n=1 Tax=Marasmiellus scandens TaxID=2682957 RepID=A0ABR1J981_9AGAR
MGVPACLWRRTGEIYKRNREFSQLVGVDGYLMREGRLCIYELMAEESVVNYWEKYGNVAADSSQKSRIDILRVAVQASAEPCPVYFDHQRQQRSSSCCNHCRFYCQR